MINSAPFLASGIGGSAKSLASIGWPLARYEAMRLASFRSAYQPHHTRRPTRESMSSNKPTVRRFSHQNRGGYGAAKWLLCGVSLEEASSMQSNNRRNVGRCGHSFGACALNSLLQYAG